MRVESDEWRSTHNTDKRHVPTKAIIGQSPKLICFLCYVRDRSESKLSHAVRDLVAISWCDGALKRCGGRDRTRLLTGIHALIGISDDAKLVGWSRGLSKSDQIDDIIRW